MLRHNADASETAVLPTENTRDVHTFTAGSCSNGHGCSFHGYQMNGTGLDSKVLTWRDPSADLAVVRHNQRYVQPAILWGML